MKKSIFETTTCPICKSLLNFIASEFICYLKHYKVYSCDVFSKQTFTYKNIQVSTFKYIDGFPGGRNTSDIHMNNRFIAEAPLLLLDLNTDFELLENRINLYLNFK